MNDFLTSLSQSWLGSAYAVAWGFPLLETLHFIGLCILFGGLLIIDARILGFARQLPMKPAMSFTSMAVAGFAIAATSGIFMFCSDPLRYVANPVFLAKITLILLAGLNALWFWFGAHGRLASLADGETAASNAKTIAWASLALWTGVIVLGRLIPYVE
ncbi:MAG: hypothetical protein IT494_09855 [Gammaproteobacteria bacterium]|nr:hypothetical protein [Gammaproteobacteria bacterium]